MKVTFSSKLFLVASIMVGLLFAWDACLAQQVDIGMEGGACYSCGEDPCDWHDVNCEAKEGEKCGKDDSCCRGPDTGEGFCNPMPPGHYQCVYTGCESRHDETCNDP